MTCRGCGAAIVLTAYGWGHVATRYGGDKHPAVPASRPALEADPPATTADSRAVDPRGLIEAPVEVSGASLPTASTPARTGGSNAPPGQRGAEAQLAYPAPAP